MRNTLLKSFLFWQVAFLFWLFPVVSFDVPFLGEHSTACLDAVAAVLKEIQANYSCASQPIFHSPDLSRILGAPKHPPSYLILPWEALFQAIESFIGELAYNVFWKEIIKNQSKQVPRKFLKNLERNQAGQSYQQTPL